MAIVALFLLGVANFALHKAVLESGHPLLGQVPLLMYRSGRKFSLVLEFAILLGSMLMVDAGSFGWAWGYLAYSLLNGTSAWLILSNRI